MEPIDIGSIVGWQAGNLVKFNINRRFGRRMNLTLGAKNPSGSLKLDANFQI
jgi:hypothetical protein